MKREGKWAGPKERKGKEEKEKGFGHLNKIQQIQFILKFKEFNFKLNTRTKTMQSHMNARQTKSFI